MAKKAFIVGINYKGTGYDLRGCINDANNVRNLLEPKGFAVTQLLEKEATTQGILDGLKALVKDAVPGDVLYFHYSGHGSQIYSKLEEDKLDEIICPYDLDWKTKVITDNELKAIFGSVPPGVNITVVLDCCHSGDALDQGTSLEIPEEQLSVSLPNGTIKKLKVMSKTMKQRYLAPPAEILSDIQERSLSLRSWNTTRDVNKSAILIAGCKSDQTSADATIAGQAQGAATAAMIELVKSESNITYRDLVIGMNMFMVVNKFTQRPVLDGNIDFYNRTFLQEIPMEQKANQLEQETVAPVITEDLPVSDEPVSTMPPVTPPAVEPVEEVSEPEVKKEKAKIETYIILGLLFIILAVVIL